MRNSYLNRMMTARDPRYRRIAEILGAKREPKATPESQIDHLRAKYRRLTGKTADKRWSDTTLLAKVLAAQDIAPVASDTRDEIASALNQMERKS